MKKVISVFLSMLLVFSALVPAFAADVAAENTEPENTVPVNTVPDDADTHLVMFKAPSGGFEGGYKFVRTVEGEIQYKEDPAGEYCFFEGRYMFPSNVLPKYQNEIPPERYSPVEWDAVNEVPDGDFIAFKVVTSEVYNILTVTVLINGSPATLNVNDEYVVSVDRDMNISVVESALLKNHFNVSLQSGDGYKLMTLKDENYHVSYYGDSFDFRLKVLSGYSAAAIEVSIQRGAGPFGEFLEEEDSDMLAGIIGDNEVIQSYGVDADGYRLYRIENITSDCKIIVDGIQEESNVGLMAMLKRIVRLILDFLGIQIDFLDSFTQYYTVTVDDSNAPEGVSYQVIRSTTQEFTPSEFTLTTGDGITVVVTKKDKKQVVNVSWNPGNETGEYQTVWMPSYNELTGETTYSAIYNIDNIAADTEIFIYG